jgi:hypothetical protein
MRHWIIKACALGPSVAVGATLTALTVAALPATVGAGVGAVGVLSAILIARGLGEGAVVGLLFGSRRPTAQQADELAPVVTLVCCAGLGPPRTRIRVSRCTTPAALGCGRRTVVVTTGLVDAVATERIPHVEAAAVLAHAACLVRSGLVRSDPVIGVVALPWRVVSAFGRVAGRVPGAAAVWRLRWLALGVATVQVGSQHVGLGAAIAAIGAATYVMPAWQRRWTAALVAAGDRGVADVGLGQALAAFLGRPLPDSKARARIAAVTADRAPRPMLGLVRS